MNYQNYQRARDAAWRILIDCQVRELPVSMGAICKQIGVRLYAYRDAEQLIRKLCIADIVSNTDGLSLYNGDTPVILFDGDLSVVRARFTVAHEIGHIVLGHVRHGQVTKRNRFYNKCWGQALSLTPKLFP